jgi:hypothetical protein
MNRHCPFFTDFFQVFIDIFFNGEYQPENGFTVGRQRASLQVSF